MIAPPMLIIAEQSALGSADRVVLPVPDNPRKKRQVSLFVFVG
jgi:hypothetical protein